ncbi:MAG: hypothetical protein AAGI88_10860, partial [Pseudomonadota bacterium]
MPQNHGTTSCSLAEVIPAHPAVDYTDSPPHHELVRRDDRRKVRRNPGARHKLAAASIPEWSDGS